MIGEDAYVNERLVLRINDGDIVEEYLTAIKLREMF